MTMYRNKKMSTVIKYYLRKANRKASIVEFDSGSKLLKANIYFDIIFLDIEMPQMDGIETVNIKKQYRSDQEGLLYKQNLHPIEASTLLYCGLG